MIGVTISVSDGVCRIYLFPTRHYYATIRLVIYVLLSLRLKGEAIPTQTQRVN